MPRDITLPLVVLATCTLFVGCGEKAAPPASTGAGAKSPALPRWEVATPFVLPAPMTKRPRPEEGKPYVNALGQRFGWIPPGSFRMGSSEGEVCREADEGPVHDVAIRRGFWMGLCEVTQAEFSQVMGYDPSHYKGPRRPVEQVCFPAAKAFCKRLTEAAHRAGNLPAGMAYTLPSEAQWEYACRGGTKTPFYTGASVSTDEANYNGERPLPGQPRGRNRGETSDVATFPPNPFGLFDMVGNVGEWCLDRWHPTYEGAPSDDRPWLEGKSEKRVIRGNSHWDDCRHGRSANRLGIAPEQEYWTYGFRVVLTTHSAP